jgi:hypothetical protein
MKITKINLQEENAIYSADNCLWEVKDNGLSKIIVNDYINNPIVNYYFLDDILKMNFKRVKLIYQDTPPQYARVFMRDYCGVWRLGEFDKISFDEDHGHFVYYGTYPNDVDSLAWNCMFPVDFKHQK